MRLYKLFSILSAFIVYLILNLSIRTLLLFRPQKRQQAVNDLSLRLFKRLQKIIGLKVEVKGQREYLNGNGLFFISPHVGYLDGLVMGGLVRGVFISKKEVGSWPLIGPVVRGAGTIFINRHNRLEIRDCVKEACENLKKGMNLFVFPEGTSTNGSSLRPFQTVFFGIPLAVRTPVIPLTIRYLCIDGKELCRSNRDQIFWYGTMPFAGHLWNLLKLREIKAEIILHAAVQTDKRKNNSPARKVLAQRCHQILSGYKNIGPGPVAITAFSQS